MKGLHMIFGIMSFALLSSCVDRNPTPKVTILEIEPDTARSLIDSLTIHFEYYDGDGDLGSADPQVKNLFIMDSRGEIIYKYRIPLLAPMDLNKPIQGTMSVSLNKSVNLSEDDIAVRYAVILLDRAGNSSDTVYTPEVTITP